MKIHWRIFGVIVAVLIAIALINFFMSVFFAGRKSLDTVEQDMKVIAEIGDAMVTKEIDLLISDAQTISAVVANAEPGVIAAVLEEETNRFGNFSSITLFDESGVVAEYGVSPTPATQLNGPYIQKALGGVSGISTTRIDASTNALVFHVCAPVSGHRALSVTVDGLHFSRLLENFVIWDSGSLFMLDGEGKIIAHRDRELVRDQTNFISMSDNRAEYDSIGAAFKTMIKGGSGYVQYDAFGATRLCAYTSVKGSDFGWILGASAPLDESPATRVQNGLIIASCILLVFIVTVSFFAALFLAKPYNTISEQNVRLVELSSSAQAASDAKSQFLASMSHEIRTPMNAIIGMGELMRTDNFDETQKSYFGDIRKMARSLLQIINDILDFSKIEAGRMEIIPSDYNFISLYDNILSLVNFMVEGKNLILRHSVTDNIPRILFGDEVRVRQIITNLMGNAVKYTREGWVELAISKVHAAGEDYLRICVSDSGIGIRREDMPKLFEMFEQVDAARNKDVVGTGLGLSITKRLVDMMGGEISVESEYGKGSTFTVLLPIVIGTAENLAHDADGSNRAIASPEARVLVVDDNAINLTVAVGFLERHGVYPVTAESGQQAIERLLTDKGHYDLIFMDHMMPEMDGVEATKRIRAFEGEYFKNVPIVALTANAVSGAREAFLEAGMSDFISKPISAFELNAVLLKWLPSNKLLHRATAGQEIHTYVPDEFDSIFSLLNGVNGLDPSLGLSRVDSNKTVYLNILRQFVKGADKDVAAMTAFCEGREWHDYVIRAHALKSVFANIGNPALSGWAFKLEESARALEEDVCIAGTPEFCDAILRFKRDLPGKQLLDEGTKKRVQITSATLSALIEKAEIACAECDTDALNDVVGTLAGVTYNNDIDTKIAEITELSRSFDYEAAALIAEEIRESLRA